MVKHKSQPKKPKKGGVDFKKYKRKVGRKLPPPKNATNTEVKSKAIVLPEQSIVSEKQGLALSKKGLTLKELLQHTNHHNAKVRKDALLGIKEILLKHPAELKLHKLAVIEKLRERVGDDDKLVRETLYQLFKTIVLPECAKDYQGPVVSLLMVYIFNFMTHLARDVRLTAFKFLDLVIQFFPSSFSSYAEKILHNYEDVLQKNLFLVERSKLRIILAGLFRCLELLPRSESVDSAIQNDVSDHEILHGLDFKVEVERGPIEITQHLKDLLHILVGCFLNFMPSVHSGTQIDSQSCECMHFTLLCMDLIIRTLTFEVCASEQDQLLPLFSKLNKLWDVYPLNMYHQLSEKDDLRVFMLNTAITKILMQFQNWDKLPSALLERFVEFIEVSLATKIQSGNMSYEKFLLPLIPYIPKLVIQISFDWRCRILQSFSEIFKNSSPLSSMKFACLAATTEMLVPDGGLLSLDSFDPTLLNYQIAWLQDLPSLLMSLDEKNPLCSKAVLHLQLRVGQAAPVNSVFSWAFDQMQYDYKCFFGSQSDNSIHYGPFVRLAADIQDLAICSLYYFSFMSSGLLQSVLLCCLCDELDLGIVLRILEVLQSAFRAGHVQVGDYTSFHVTLVSRFHVFAENDSPTQNRDMKLKWRCFKSINRAVCTYLSDIGDNHLVFQMLEKIIINQISGEIPVENKCGFLRLLVKLDTKPTRLSDESLHNIGNVLPQYLIDVVSNIEEDDKLASASTAKRRGYYLLPCFYLFSRSKLLLSRVLSAMGSQTFNIGCSSNVQHPVESYREIRCILFLLLQMYKDVKMLQEVLVSCKSVVEELLKNLHNFLASESENTEMRFQERHRIRSAYDRVRDIINNN